MNDKYLYAAYKDKFNVNNKSYDAAYKNRFNLHSLTTGPMMSSPYEFLLFTNGKLCHLITRDTTIPYGNKLLV